MNDLRQEEAEADNSPLPDNLPPSMLPTKTIGYHFAGLSFIRGQSSVADVAIGDPGIPGMVMVRVSYTGKRKPRLFMVSLSALVPEMEETPILVPSSPGLIVPGR